MTEQSIRGPLIQFNIDKETLEVTILPSTRLEECMVETGKPYTDERNHSALILALQAHDARRRELRDSAQ